MILVDLFGYPMTLRSESVIVSDILKPWIVIFSVLRFKGAYEFAKGEFKAFLESCNIISHISCLHTPEQSGLAGMKHRHITEMCTSFFT